jgi:hypothetical protein
LYRLTVTARSSRLALSKLKCLGLTPAARLQFSKCRRIQTLAHMVHVHHLESERFYAIEGEYEAKVGDQIFHLKAGGSVNAPKLIPHAINDLSGGKIMVMARPAGHIEALSVDLFRLSSGIHDEAAFKAVYKKHNMDVVGPPLPKRHQPTNTLEPLSRVRSAP